LNSDQIFDVIERIAQTSSKKGKEALIQEHAHDEEFKWVLKAALDPSVTYYIAKLDVLAKGKEGFTALTWKLLDRLARREVTGKEALNLVQGAAYGMTDKSAQLLKRIILKDFRAGFSESTVNKAIPGLIPVFPYMRCCLPKDAKLKNFDWAAGAFSQLKADGMFANLHVGNDAQLHSRQGSVFPMGQFEELAWAARRTFPADHQMHGELLVLRDGTLLPREVSNGILNSVLQGGVFASGDTSQYVVWDMIPLRVAVSKGKYEAPYAERFGNLAERVFRSAGLSEALPIQVIETRRVHSLEGAYVHYRELLAQGKEGTVLKDASAIWMDGTSKYQVKLKLEADCDLIIVGFNPGEGKNEATFGSVIVRTADSKLEVSVSGFKDEVRRQIHERRDQLLGTVMTVRANSIMPANDEGVHSLFLPRFVELRQDKKEGDTLQRVVDQFEAAIKAA
jgi:DNA ligase-1